MLICTIAINAQKPIITLVDTSKKVSIRGLSVVDDNVIWCSGSNGSVARSIDGGKTFIWQNVAGYEKRDFRDIEAFDANSAIIMGIAEPAIILKTKDGGQTWKKVFEDSTKGMFLDAMDFDKKGYGVVIGDPINNHSFFATTKNKGDSWKIVLNTYYYKAGEAYFASSGTNLKIIKQKFGFSPPNYLNEINVSGGSESNFSINRHTLKLPIAQGKESTGANSIDVWKNKAVIVGGDFANDKDTTGNCVLVDFEEFPKFSFPQTPPHGYRSCVIYINEKTLLTCGTSGVDVSYDGGKNWQLISMQSFHVVQKAKNGKAIFLAGSSGKIAKLEL
ncbi:MAG: oxidoreductase [Deinococcales bacterium]|nr:oxidoreductase [Chitinophagaceae bacterium]